MIEIGIPLFSLTQEQKKEELFDMNKECDFVDFVDSIDNEYHFTKKNSNEKITAILVDTTNKSRVDATNILHDIINKLETVTSHKMIYLPSNKNEIISLTHNTDVSEIETIIEMI